MLIRSVVSAAIVGCAAVIISSAVTPAVADDVWTQASCEKSPSRPECTVKAGSSKTSAPTSDGASGSGARRCTDQKGATVPCSDPKLGQLGGDGCYYKPVEVSAADAKFYGGAGEGPGGWYEQTCVDAAAGTMLGSIVWRADGAVQVDPVVVARQAVSRLRLVVPVISASPSVDRAQLVSLPTWLWIQPAAWGSLSATAAAPGVSVTATATPVRVTWSLGDGSTVVCRGPGTPFPAGGDPKAASPDCGHTYRRSSAGQPGEAFRVTAAITWSITWAGGGQAGELPALETAGVAALRVAESQALVTGSSAR